MYLVLKFSFLGFMIGPGTNVMLLYSSKSYLTCIQLTMTNIRLTQQALFTHQVTTSRHNNAWKPKGNLSFTQTPSNGRQGAMKSIWATTIINASPSTQLTTL